ncbi:MAG: sugar phosphate isomerase/epimerase [Clostridia bacterium]|nr:sugar phosphate isomerase/epimerase [Clostridia bacterium]
MIRTLDTSMLNFPYTYRELAPIAARFGIQALSVPGSLFESEETAAEATAYLAEYGLRWGLLPLPADFYHWDLTDEAFDAALETLRYRAEIGQKSGITHAYNHVWPTGPRAFDENFDCHVRRVLAVSSVLRDAGIRYGLEFLGPHELRTWQKYEFVHSLSGVLAIADAADGIAGIAFDTFHWYCSAAGCPDDLLYMTQHTERLVAVHLNDAVAGVPYSEQKDMQRRLPMETGVIDSRDILRRFMAHPNDALYMIEPFEPGRSKFHAMSAEEGVRTASDIFTALEN